MGVPRDTVAENVSLHRNNFFAHWMHPDKCGSTHYPLMYRDF